MSNPELLQLARNNIIKLAGEEKQAFVPADQLGGAAGGMPPGAPMDPAMMAGGMPPGAPPMDPAMMAGGAPPGPPMDPAMMAGGMPPGAPPGAAPGGQPVQVSIDDLRMIMMEAVQAAMMLMQGQMGQAQPAAPAGGGEGGQEGEGEAKQDGGGEGGGGGGDLEQRLAMIEQALGMGAPAGAAPAGPPAMPGMPLGGGTPAAPPAPSPGMQVAASVKSGDRKSALSRTLGAIAAASK